MKDALKDKYAHIIDYFKRTNPEAKSELHFSNPFQLLVAVMLSAQCTDKRVNSVTPALFARFSTAEDMAKASVSELLELIKSISYPNSKALHLSEMAKKLVSDFHCEVPSTMEELQTLPGVGRKTANVMMAVAFGKPAMPVDTHVFRVASRIGLVKNATTPLETERQLTENIPSQYLSDAHHWILLHGRYVCTARNPQCGGCGIKQWCDYMKQQVKVEN
ncbi:MAG: endonuclease III [Bacteroidales bacterium]|nr:endonuclease III [Bacteroidales bacterium]